MVTPLKVCETTMAQRGVFFHQNWITHATEVNNAVKRYVNDRQPSPTVGVAKAMVKPIMISHMTRS